MRGPPGVTLVLFAGAIGLFAVAAWERDRPTAPVKRAIPSVDVALLPDRTAPASLDFRFNALDPGAAATNTAVAAFDPDHDTFGMPDGDGVDLVCGYCSSCHTVEIVMQQRASPERWSELLRWMVDKQGMAPMHPEDATLVHAYLSETFPRQP